MKCFSVSFLVGVSDVIQQSLKPSVLLIPKFYKGIYSFDEQDKNQYT